MRTVLNPAADMSTPEKSQAYSAIRMLRDNTEEKDGTQKFIFIFDPWYDGIEYEIEKVLVAKYGPEKGKQLNEEFGRLTTFYEFHDMKQLAAK